jgi:putative transposase
LPQSGNIGAKLRDEVLNREVFFTLKEAKIVIENWRQEYNTIRPHSSLNGLPPAPEAILPLSFQPPQLIRNSSEWGSTLT